MLDQTKIRAEGLLAFNGQFAYLMVAFLAPGQLSTPGVLALRADDLSEVARYATPERVQSVTEVGDKFVFGMPSTLSVASPACR